MIHPSTIEIKDYTYQLPNKKIALYPLEQRDASKLLVYKEGAISETIYRSISTEFPNKTLLLFNNTKVIEARIFFQKSTGGVVEIFCLEPAYKTEITQAMMSRGKVVWNCLIGGAAKWKNGQLEKKITANNETIRLFAEVKERLPNYFAVEFSWYNAELSFAEVLHLAGVIPLPPYLNRRAEKQDYDRYQTVYAKQEGSVAAPTAGLHFTPQLIDQLLTDGVYIEQVTLHVGAGTFQPVKTQTIGEHEMHKEWIDVKKSTIETILNHKQNIIPVGTTSLRTLETLYWMGVKVLQNAEATIDELEIKQWDAYDLQTEDTTTETSLKALLGWMNTRQLEQLICQTQILIAPGYQIKIADALLTNFHQPNSTLLLLVAAFIGKNWKQVYEFALANDYRFLSYGDGSLLWNKKQW